MKKALPIVIALVIIGAGIFWYLNRPDNVNDLNNISQSNRSLSLTMVEQNQSSQSGTVNIYENGSQTKIEITLRNSPAGPQPAHIHTGSCAEIGGVKYPLTSIINGTSDTTLDVSYDDLLAQLPLAINAHKSVAESSVYIACADVKTSSDTSSTMPIIDGNVSDIVVSIDPATPADEPVSSPTSAKVFNITGRNFAFSQNEIRVKKGDTVTINFSSQSGFHDLIVDEFNAATKQVNPGEPTSVTFTADRTGTFEYYCSVGSHRSMGMKGKLIVE